MLALCAMRSARIPADQTDDPRAIVCERVKQIIRDRGLMGTYGPHLGVSRPAMNSWRVIPAEHCIGLEELVGVSRYEMRPDVFGVKPNLEAERDKLRLEIHEARAALSFSDLPDKAMPISAAIYDLIRGEKNANARADLAEAKLKMLEATA